MLISSGPSFEVQLRSKNFVLSLLHRTILYTVLQ